MQLSVLPLLSAPPVAGHAQGLPGERPEPPAPDRIKPILDARNPEARLKEGLAPSKFWRAATGQPDPATGDVPPSILQIRITRLLEDQAPPDRARIEPSARLPREQSTPPEAAAPGAGVAQSVPQSDARRPVLSSLP